MELVFILLVIALDRFTKIWAFNHLYMNNNIVIIKGFFELSYLENRGAAWGILQNQTIFLVVISLIIILGIVGFYIKYRPKSLMLRLSLSLIIGGALGNMYDRVFNKFVIDFIYFHYNNVYSFPTFNVADMSVVVGTFLLAIYILRNEKDGKNSI
jgi:signal peptidase II